MGEARRSGTCPRPDTHSQFRIGRDHSGHWVVQDERGLCGGLFVNRAEALKFALFENGHRPQAVIMMPGLFELSFAQRPKAIVAPPGTRRVPRAA